MPYAAVERFDVGVLVGFARLDDEQQAVQQGLGKCSPISTILRRPEKTAPRVRIPLLADSDSIPIADSVPGDGGHLARVS